MPAAPAFRPLSAPAVIVSALVVTAIVLVGLSLTREPPATWPPTTGPAPADSADPRPRVFTVDAAEEDDWVFFSFEQGGVVPDPGPVGWDLGFRRFHIIANGGVGFAGSGGVADLGVVAFDSVTTVPDGGYVATRAARDSTNDAIAHWYRYGFTSHMLSPGRRIYAVRTADGRYAKLEVLGYYCPGPVAGCVTIRYAYQPRGGRNVGGGG